MSADTAPLILTARLPDDLHARFTALRTAHFPPERNFLEAHVTLFHAIPYLAAGEVESACQAFARDCAPVPARVEGIMSLGGGTAIRIASPAMLALRERIAERLHGLLTLQDSHAPRLHVTIQNKVTSAEAKALQLSLIDAVPAQEFAFPGLALFRYRGGPWEAVRSYAFRGRGRD